MTSDISQEDMDRDESMKKLAELLGRKLKENLNSNFKGTLEYHFTTFFNHADAVREKGALAFVSRKEYQLFAAAKLFMDKVEFFEFQNSASPNLGDDFEEDATPPFEAFHFTSDEKEMRKNRVLENIKNGDVLHLRVIEENSELYKLLILNKYGEKERIFDYLMFAELYKNNRHVQEIQPALQVFDHIRATILGNVKQEKGVYKKVLVSLNPNFIRKDMKFLKLGRIFKKDIPYYPEPISQFHSLGGYLKATTRFENPKLILKRISAFGCNPLKTGPFYHTRYEKILPKPVDDSLVDEMQKLNISCQKTKQAVKLLESGDLVNALNTIEEALLVTPDNDVALTIRGKIYLAKAGGKPSSNVKKAFLDFEAAIRLNVLNETAKEFHDTILLQSSRSYSKKNMPKKAKEVEACLKNPNRINEDNETFLRNLKMETDSTDRTRSPSIESGTAGSITIPAVDLKSEPMQH